jgi:Asp-tRNA(Asn)/Glu-tRNA(Gln) amidotransferase A subunit family amidase
MKGSAGLPVGIQVVGNFNKDELVLRVMRELQEKIRFKAPAVFEHAM